MPRRRERLTLDEHLAFGAELKRMRAYLVRQAARLYDAYGSTKRPGRLADRVCTAIDQLRSELEKRLVADSESWPEADRRAIEGPLPLPVYYARGDPGAYRARSGQGSGAPEQDGGRGARGSGRRSGPS